MDNINKAAAAGVIFFMIVLAGFVGIKIDQTTVALLGGAFIGLVIAIPTTALIVLIGMKRRDESPADSQPQVIPTQPYQQPMFQMPPIDMNLNIRVEQVWLYPPEPSEVANTLAVIEMESPETYEWWQLRDIAARAVGRTPREAGGLMRHGLIRFVSPKQAARLSGSVVRQIAAPK